MSINTHFASQQRSKHHIQKAIQPNFTVGTKFTVNRKLAEEYIDASEKDKLGFKSPYYEEHNFYCHPHKMGFPVEKAVASLAKRVDSFNRLWIDNLERHKEYSPICYNERLKSYIDVCKTHSKSDYRVAIAIAKTRNTLIHYLNLHDDPENIVTLSNNTIEGIEKTLDDSVNPYQAPQEESSSDKTASSHNSGSVFTSETSTNDEKTATKTDTTDANESRVQKLIKKFNELSKKP